MLLSQLLSFLYVIILPTNRFSNDFDSVQHVEELRMTLVSQDLGHFRPEIVNEASIQRNRSIPTIKKGGASTSSFRLDQDQTRFSTSLSQELCQPAVLG